MSAFSLGTSGLISWFNAAPDKATLFRRRRAALFILGRRHTPRRHFEAWTDAQLEVPENWAMRRRQSLQFARISDCLLRNTKERGEK